eukprot:GFUD01008768.1.p1 GENE.GFUD01008768.1~~GFUD01008768.1.p1  ORF type:complete len:292 (+),score=57.88 GFUD01008768.1:54-929(+)
MIGKTCILLLLRFVFISGVFLSCFRFKKSKNFAKVEKEAEKQEITFDWSSSISEDDWTFFDYVQLYKDNTPIRRVKKGENVAMETYKSSVNLTTFIVRDICKSFSFEVKFFEEESNCEKFSIKSTYEAKAFFDLDSPQEHEIVQAKNKSSLKIFPKTNLVEDDDFLKCIVFTEVVFEAGKFDEVSSDGSILVDINNLGNCQNLTVELRYTLKNGDILTKMLSTSSHCPYEMSVLEKGLLFGGLGLLGLLCLLTMAVIVHKKLESRQFLDVVIDYTSKDEDTVDISMDTKEY